MRIIKKSIFALCIILSGFTNLYSQNDTSNRYHDGDVISEYRTVVQEQPKFPGDMNKYIADSIRYPEEAKKKNIQGKVYVYCFIEKDGSISHIQVLRSPDESLSKEAERLVSTMPKWIPAKNNGVPLRIQYSILINFKL